MPRRVETGVVEGLQIQLLGRFRVQVGPRRIPEAAWRPKAARLVKLLALAPGHRLHREQVMEVLWPEFEPQAAFNNLHRTLHAARHILEPDLPPGTPSTYLHLRAQGLALFASVGVLWIDVEAFEIAAGVARHARDPATYRAALELYTGELLPEDRYEDWAACRREELRERYLMLLLNLMQAHEERGEVPAAIQALELVVATEPTHESAHTNLIRLLALSGRRQKALRQYERLRDVLAHEVGAEPATASQCLYRDILAGRFPPAAASAIRAPNDHEQPACLPSAGRRSQNLPTMLTTFIGRKQEIADVKRLLGITRLVTLTGAGGVGKTRLALQVATDLVEAGKDDVCVVDLAALADPRLVPPTVAVALGIRDQPGQPLVETLVDALQSSAVLLVLDNCEHVLESCANLAEILLQACVRLRLLVTSRAPLDIAGETVWRVPSLAVPDPPETLPDGMLVQYDAVRLFLERAQAVRPGFELTPANALTVAGLCRRLDGIPLALELAAGRLKVLPVQELAMRLDDVLGLLVGSRRTAPSRHRTLRATLDWSHALLSEPERTLFRRLSAFANGWTLAAAEAVAAGGSIQSQQVLDLLAQVVDKSLVLAEEHDGRARFRLLEPVRQYALQQLREAGEETPIGGRLLAWSLALAEEAESGLTGPEQALWLQRLETEHANLRAALGWALDQRDAEAALRLGGALGRFWEERGYLSEGLHWLEEALAQGQKVPATTRARAKAVAGRLAWLQGDYARAQVFVEESLALYREQGEMCGIAETLDQLGVLACSQRQYARAVVLHEESLSLCRRLGDRQGMARVLTHLGQVASDRGDFTSAAVLHTESMVLLRALGDKARLADALNNLGDVAYDQGDYVGSASLHAESLALAQELGDTRGIALALNNLGRAARQQGDYRRAAVLFEESLALRRALGVKWGIATSLSSLADLAKRQREWRRAAALCAESLVLLHELGDTRGMATGLEDLAGVLGGRGQAASAAQLLGAAAVLRETIGAPLPPALHAGYQCTVAMIRGGLDEAAFTTAWMIGRALTAEQAITAALTAALGNTVAERMPQRQRVSLSEREQQVAALVAQGGTNRRVAAALGLAERTVDAHVSHILAKLALTSRAQIRAWAEERRLQPQHPT